MGYLSTDKKKITTKTYAEMKAAGEKVTMLTAYDFTTAGIIDAAGIDTILIGDSASNVMAGNADTLPVTVDQMIYHARSVARACNHALVLCDMPFGSYQVCKEDALRNACRMMKETGVDALKLEGDRLLIHMRREVAKTTHGGAPGKPDWRREIANNLDHIATAVTGDSVSMDFGYSPSGKADEVRAMIVAAGSGSAAGGSAIHAGPPGRSVWDDDVSLRHFRALAIFRYCWTRRWSWDGDRRWRSRGSSRRNSTTAGCNF